MNTDLVLRNGVPTEEEVGERLAEYDAAETEEDRALRLTYEAIAAKRKVVVVRQAIENGGRRKTNDFSRYPAVVIAPATAKKVYVDARTRPRGQKRRAKLFAGDWAYDLPHAVIRWPDLSDGCHFEAWTLVPHVPPRIRTEHGLDGKFILFEAEDWVETRNEVIKPRPPSEPALLSHLVGDIYLVDAVWELTDLEVAVLAGISRA